jgi:hypothetical protein
LEPLNENRGKLGSNIGRWRIAREQHHMTQDPAGGVMSPRVEFAWPIWEDSWAEAHDDWPTDDPAAFRAANAVRLAQPMVEVLNDLDLQCEVRSIGYGRGFEVEGIALVVIAAVEVMANLDGMIGFAQRVRAAYRRFRSSQDADGNQLSLPTLSLGAAKVLALAHLFDQLGGDFVGIRQIAATVINPVEPDHSGNDLFLIVLGRTDATWTYLLDALGHVVSFTAGQPLQKWIGIYWGFDSEELPESLPTIADES